VNGTSATDGEGASAQLDTSEAHSARVWNYLLGGKDNFAADRQTGDLILKMFPAIEMNQAIAVYNQNSASSYHLRSPEQITAFFAGLDVVPPGVISTSRWRPDLRDAEEEPREVDSYAGIARKP
jgi:hypothetical protein